MDCFFCCAMGRLGNVDWSYSAWDSAASSFVLDSGLLVKFRLKYNYYTCFNVMPSAKALSTVHFLRLDCCATSGIFHG